MAIVPEEQYPNKIIPASLDYPHGRARNVTAPGDGTGTPLEQAWVNDLFGWQQALLAEAGIVPTGAPDTARNSQYLDAMNAIYADTYDLASILNRLYDLENKVYEDTPVNQVIWVDQHFETPEQVAAYKGYGTWVRALKGRVAVGFSDIVADPADFKTFGAKYGAATHTLTIAQMPSHNHPIQDGGNPGPGAGGQVETGTQVPYLEGSQSVGYTGANQPHNNVQPSQTLDCWKRTA